LFRAKDVAEWIEHSDVSVMIETIGKVEQPVRKVFFDGKALNIRFLTERGLYEALRQSENPTARQLESEIQRVINSFRIQVAPLVTAGGDLEGNKQLQTF